LNVANLPACQGRFARTAGRAGAKLPLLSQGSGLTGGKKMNKHVDALDVQQEIDPRYFARQLGIKPLQGRATCAWPYDRDLFYAAFGPPETDNRTHPSVLFWNFVESDGAPAFNLCLKFPARRKVFLVARQETDTAYSDTAYLWTAKRIGEAEIEPLFLGAREFIISHAS
jgi:hypothetical protein